jgi:endonuclease G
MDSTFCLSLVTLQNRELNEVFWNKIERHVQLLIQPGDRAWILTSPAFFNTAGGEIVRVHTAGDDRLWIPTHFIKSVLLLKKGQEEPESLVTWLVPNDRPAADAKEDDFRCSVDFAERRRGLDFWPLLPEPLQSKLEAVE